jgi:Cu+-exporting ATPase
LERARNIGIVLFDKTGTLTEGKPQVQEIVPSEGYSVNDVLRLAASIEQFSEHPVAQAIIRKAQSDGIAPEAATGFENLAGKGATGRLHGKQLHVGSPRLMKELGGMSAMLESKAAELEGKGHTVVLVAQDRKALGLIAVADTLKADAAPAIAALHARGVRTVMLTGDNRRAAQSIASVLGIDEVRAEILPGQKADEVKALQAQGVRVAFVGDGINDAPALAQADLGIAIGTGTDIAIEAGQVVLVKGSPMKVIEALDLSNTTFRAIRQNMFWAFFYNIAAVPLAALGLLNPMIAAGAMAFSSLSVVGNSLRIRLIMKQPEGGGR